MPAMVDLLDVQDAMRAAQIESQRVNADAVWTAALLPPAGELAILKK